MQILRELLGNSILPPYQISDLSLERYQLLLFPCETIIIRGIREE
jgi:hypothetical protein